MKFIFFTLSALYSDMPQINILYFPMAIFFTSFAFVAFYFLTSYLYIRPYLELKSRRSEIINRIDAEMLMLAKLGEEAARDIEDFQLNMNKEVEQYKQDLYAQFAMYKTNRLLQLEKQIERIDGEAALFISSEFLRLKSVFLSEAEGFTDFAGLKLDAPFKSTLVTQEMRLQLERI